MSPESALRQLSRASGLDLILYRPEHVAERVRRALERERVDGNSALIRLLEEDPEARTRFRRSVAISVSGLFRDSEQFERLEEEILPQLLAGGTRRVTVWSAGCADGSELYSVGVLLNRLRGLDRALLLGSDVLEENISSARRGLFAETSVSDPVCARTRWERRDVVRDGPPPGKWRLVICRNLGIYLAPGAKVALHQTLAQALAHDGFLMLGRSERIGDPGGYGLGRAGPHLYRKVPQWA